MIKSQSEFEEYLNRVEKAFDIHQRLPGMVFKLGFTGFAFAEFDWAMSADFWEFIKFISKDNNTGSILLAVLEPDPIEYFFKEFGEYSFSDLPIGCTSDEYWTALETAPDDSPADAPLYNSDVVAWIPSSLDWAIWGQRNLGFCVFASNSTKYHAGVNLTQEWLSPEEALTILLPINFVDRIVPESLSKEFLLAYKSQGKLGA